MEALEGLYKDQRKYSYNEAKKERALNEDIREVRQRQEISDTVERGLHIQLQKTEKAINARPQHPTKFQGKKNLKAFLDMPSYHHPMTTKHGL